MSQAVLHNIDLSKDPIPLLLHLADSALIISHKQSEWCGHGPVLEQDIAITNLSLDLLGQARNFYQYAATLISNENIDEDKLAYHRDDRAFKNFVICELPNGDWAQTVLKLFFFSTYQQLLFNQLLNSTDTQIAAIAEKSLKETNYHVRWSADWVIRLGDGTDESKHRLINAFNNIWIHVREFFEPTNYELDAAKSNIYYNTALLKDTWLSQVKQVFEEATLALELNIPTHWSGLNGKQGLHTEHLGFILAEMQHLQRAYPNAQW
jgi:ring-1,2-phenylacetyl-CoA epoxidase subunit PaaC